MPRTMTSRVSHNNAPATSSTTSKSLVSDGNSGGGFSTEISDYQETTCLLYLFIFFSPQIFFFQRQNMANSLRIFPGLSRAVFRSGLVATGHRSTRSATSFQSTAWSRTHSARPHPKIYFSTFPSRWKHDVSDEVGGRQLTEGPESTAQDPRTTSEPGSTKEEKPAEEVPAYQMTFTCKKCQTRSSHRVSKQGYHHGTVLIKCPGCNNRHLISDHLKVCIVSGRTDESRAENVTSLIIWIGRSFRTLASQSKIFLLVRANPLPNAQFGPATTTTSRFGNEFHEPVGRYIIARPQTFLKDEHSSL